MNDDIEGSGMVLLRVGSSDMSKVLQSRAGILLEIGLSTVLLNTSAFVVCLVYERRGIRRKHLISC